MLEQTEAYLGSDHYSSGIAGQFWREEGGQMHTLRVRLFRGRYTLSGQNECTRNCNGKEDIFNAGNIFDETVKK